MNSATMGRVYGGDPRLIHIPDGQRERVGKDAADFMDGRIRMAARRQLEIKPLCPGCYMVAGFDMLVALAQDNGQSLKELGLTMAQAFQELASEEGDPFREEIRVILDPEETPCPIS